MSSPRTRAWEAVDDRPPETPRGRRRLSPALTSVLPVVLLIAAVSTDRFGIRWHSINLRLELIAAVVLGLAALVTGRLAGIRIGLIEFCLAGWLAVAAFSSLAFSPVPRVSLRLTLILVGMVALYGLTLLFLRSGADLSRAAVVWIGVGTLVAAIGAVEAILYVLVDSHAGIAFDGSAFGTVVVITPRVTSTMWEPNIFGSYLLTVWALAFALSRSPVFRTPWRKWALRIAMAAAATGIVLSTTRVVWVVAALLGLSMVAFSLYRGILAPRNLLADFVNPSLAGIAVGLALAMAMSVATCPISRNSGALSSSPNPSAGAPPATANPFNGPGCARGGSAFFQQSSGFFHANTTSSFTGRLTIARLALKGWLHRPIFGNGSGSYTYIYGSQGGGWIGNLELHLLFDTGIAGLFLLLVALASAGRRALRGLSTAWDATHYVLFGLVAATLALIATYQFTDGTWLGFTWVFFGMLVVAERLTTGIGQRLRSA